MYQPRTDLEDYLRSAVRSNKHIVIHGESGCGKSWLHQKVLTDLRASTQSINLANAARQKSITKEFGRILSTQDPVINIGYSETKGFQPSGIGISNERQYEISQPEPFLALLKSLRKKAKTHPAVIVFENLEQVLKDQAILLELTQLLVLVDDPEYGKYNIRIVIIGTPSNITEYLAQVGDNATLSNRLYELPEVSRLSRESAKALAHKGLFTTLSIATDDPDHILAHVIWVTDQIPQHLHEYCLILASIAQKNDWTLTNHSLQAADHQWIKESLLSEKTALSGHLNSRHTTTMRRNQVIYAIGCCEKSEFRHTDIEDIVRREFSDNTRDRSLNISGTLTELAGGQTPLIKRTPKGDAYRITSPKHRMCIRALLRKNRDGTTVRPIESSELY